MTKVFKFIQSKLIEAIISKNSMTEVFKFIQSKLIEAISFRLIGLTELIEILKYLENSITSNRFGKLQLHLKISFDKYFR